MLLQILIFFTYGLALLFPQAIGTATSGTFPPAYRAPLHRPGGINSVEDTYVVKFFDGHTLEQHYNNIGVNLSTSHQLIQSFRFLPGYHAQLEQDLLDRVRGDTGVQYVEQDHVKEHGNHTLEFSNDVPEPDDPERKDSRKVRRWVLDKFTNSKWPRAMMSAAGKLTGGRFSPQNAAFIKDVGRGVDIYIFDSGIRLTHDEFGGRAKNFQDKETSQFCDGETVDDINGHGTVVASCAAGKTLGMASSANLINVKVMCGPKALMKMSSEVTAVEAVLAEHVSRKGQGDFKGSIINLSFSNYVRSKTEADIYDSARDKGVVAVASAGNNGAHRTKYPCNYDSVICVAASNRGYTLWKGIKAGSGSNYGSHVAIVAPGQNIAVASNKGDSELDITSGTSLSTPFVAGTAATWISYENLQNDVDTVVKRLKDNALTDELEDLPGGTPNVLANNGILRTPQVGVPDQLPYIGAPPLGSLEEPQEAAMKKVKTNSNATADGGLSSIITDTSTAAYTVASTSAAVLPEPSFNDDCEQIVVLQRPDHATTMTVRPEAVPTSDT